MALAIVDKDTGEHIADAVEVPTGKSDTPAGGSRQREDKDFVKLYRHFIAQIADLGMEDNTALKVLLFLIKHMDGTNSIGAPMQLIADMTHLSRQTVSNKIKYLAQNGWIEVYKLGRSNVYVINPNVVWTSYADQKAYCKFKATLMLSSVDQWAVKPNDRTQIKYLDPLTARRMADEEFPDVPTNSNT